MKIKTLYQDLSTTSRNIFTVLNTNLLNSVWTSGETPFTTNDELTGLSNKLWVSNMEKIVSCYVENYCELNDIDISIITDNEWKTLLIMLFAEYKDKWLKLFENIAVKEYESIWNVDGTESITRTFEHGKTTTNTKNLTHTMNKGSTDTTTVISNITENSRNGFNSATPVNTDKSSNTGSTTVTGSGYDSDVDSGTDTYVDSGVDTERTTNIRGGNIGTTMTQTLLESERTFREKFNYFKVISEDIIHNLTYNIY